MDIGVLESILSDTDDSQLTRSQYDDIEHSTQDIRILELVLEIEQEEKEEKEKEENEAEEKEKEEEEENSDPESKYNSDHENEEYNFYKTVQNYNSDGENEETQKLTEEEEKTLEELTTAWIHDVFVIKCPNKNCTTGLSKFYVWCFYLASFKVRLENKKLCKLIFQSLYPNKKAHIRNCRATYNSKSHKDMFPFINYPIVLNNQGSALGSKGRVTFFPQLKLKATIKSIEGMKSTKSTDDFSSDIFLNCFNVSSENSQAEQDTVDRTKYSWKKTMINLKGDILIMPNKKSFGLLLDMPGTFPQDLKVTFKNERTMELQFHENVTELYAQCERVVKKRKITIPKVPMVIPLPFCPLESDPNNRDPFIFFKQGTVCITLTPKVDKPTTVNSGCYRVLEYG